MTVLPGAKCIPLAIAMNLVKKSDKTNRIYKFFSSRAKRALEAFLGEVCISVTPNDERRRLNSFDLITGFSGTFKSSKSFCISLIFVPVSGNSYSV